MNLKGVCVIVEFGCVHTTCNPPLSLPYRSRLLDNEFFGDTGATPSGEVRATYRLVIFMHCLIHIQ